MPQRLVYAPKVYAYTKNAQGTLYNLTNYVTAGNVDRKLNQVSTATITLRNPYRIFTTHAGSDGQPTGAAFHPQDPITIYLERITGYPVRVFTGYLDETPYYQLYPGTITLSASCTLKRLLYSYFDPSLPYLIAFFEKYGWINTGKGSMIASQAFDAKQTTTQAAVNAGTKPFTDLQDGSLGKLLWATLFDIGQWQDGNIYIEDIPSGPNGIAARMASLMQSMQQQQQQASSEFTKFLEAVVGTGSQGSGGGNTGNSSGTAGALTGSSNAAKIWNYLEPIFGAIGTAGALGNMAQETGGGTLSGIDTADSGTGASGMGGMGIVQWTAGRRDNEIAYARSQNLQPTDLQAQLGFLVQEVHQSYPDLIPAMQNASSPSDAALKWNKIYEGGTDPGGIREQAAEQAYGQFRNSSSGINAVTQATSSVIAGAGATASGAATAAGNVAGTATGTLANGASISRIQAMTNAAQALTNAKTSYTAARPAKAGAPTNGGFDCSASTAAVLSAAHAGIEPGAAVGSDQTIISSLQGAGLIQPGPGRGTPEVTLWDSSGVHIFMSINGRYFGTSDGAGAGSSAGGGWLNDGHPDTNSFTPYHFAASYLNQTVTYAAPKVGSDAGAVTASGGSGGGSSSSGGTSNTVAQAFTAELQLPSIEDQVTAIALGNEGKGLMHDQSLMPFVQQLAQASLRSFTSLPNGDFYAFYPDYFGEMGTKPVYWIIDDIEILDGGINLSDAGLSTHVYAVGDNSWPVNNELINELFSAGTVTVYNAFLGNLVVDTNSGHKAAPTNSQKSKKGTKGSAASQAQAAALDPGSNLSGNIMNADEAAKFVERYGARPLVQNYPMVRSAIYEMLLAYQQFMTAWATQFNTPFTFTFMPEVFPGGKVAFAKHGLQMYVDEVVHQWDYTEGGFTTTATLSAPAIWNDQGSNPDLPPNMIRAMVEPVSQTPISDPTLGGVSAQKQKQIAQRAANDAGKAIKGATQGLKGLF